MKSDFQYMRTRFYLILLFTWLPFHAVIGLDMRSYLLSAEEEAAELVPTLEIPTANGLLTWFDEPEARFNVSDDDEQSYSIRFRPRFGEERFAEQMIHELESQRRRLIQESILNDALQKRYTVLIDILEQQTEIDYLDEKVDLLRKKINLCRNLVQTYAFDPEQLEIVELEFSEVKQYAKLNAARLETMVRQAGFAGGKMLALLKSRSKWLLPLSELLDIVAPLSDQSDVPDANPRVRNDHTDLRTAQEDLELARKKDNPFLRFLELKYTDKIKNVSEVSLSFAISLGSMKSRYLRREFDIRNAEALLLRRRLEMAHLLRQKHSTIHWLSDQSQAVENILADISLRMSRHHKQDNPRSLLRMKEEQFAQQRRLKELHFQAMRTYIDYLYSSGQLIEQPLRNWLRIEQPFLKGDTE